MRIAFVTPYLPAPANTGGRIRMFRLAQAVASRHELALFACGGERDAAALADSVELKTYAEVHVRNNDLGAVPPLVSSKRVRRHSPRRLANDLEDAHAARPFDALIVCHSYAAGTTRKLVAVPTIVDEHNIESAYQLSYFESEKRGAGRLDRREVSLLAEWEREVWQHATLVTCVSESDARLVRAQREGAVEVVPNGAAIERITYVAPSKRKGRDVLFVGLMSHAPNEAAAKFLALEVMPRVWQSEPAARLVLCGRSPSKKVHALAQPGIEVTGTVDAIEPYLDRSAVYANALMHGAGTSLKVPEAMAAGLPFVSTDLGVRGFPVEPGEHYARATTADEFAAEIVRVLAARDRYDERAARARTVAEAYDWNLIAARFVDLVDTALDRARASA